jgi:hypothetical protein
MRGTMLLGIILREKRLPVPPIVGGLAAVAGIVIIIAGSRKP